MNHAISIGACLALSASLIHPATARDLHVDVHHPAATDDGDGSPGAPYRSIDAAAQIAEPGDTVWVHPGVYRERVAPARGGTAEAPIIYRAVVRRQAVVKGSDLFAPDWQPVHGLPRVYRAALPPTAHRDYPPPYRTAPEVGPAATNDPVRPWTDASTAPPLTLGQLYIDGQPAPQLATADAVAACPGAWAVEPAGDSLILHLPPAQRAPADAVYELTVRAAVFAPQRRGLTHIQVHDFVFEHAANQGPFPQTGLVSVRSGRHWTITGNVIRHAATIGLDIGSETWRSKTLLTAIEEDRRPIIGGHHTVIDNLVTENGLSGIAGWSCADSRIIGNTVTRNNRHGFRDGVNATWEEEAGIKLHACYRVVVEANDVRQNDGAGIWLDGGYAGARIARNLVVDNLGKGIFLELGHGPATVECNIVAHTRRSSGFWAGHGIYMHDASGITVRHNLLVQNAGSQVLARVVTEREFGSDKLRVSASRIAVVGNIFAGSGQAAISLPWPSPRSQEVYANCNLHIGRATVTWNSNSGRVSEAAARADIAARPPPATPLDLPEKLIDSELPLAVWQAVLGWEIDSRAVPDGHWLINDGVLQSPPIPAAWTLAVTPAGAPAPEQDFFGRPMPPTSIAGPFAELPAGPFRRPVIPLWLPPPPHPHPTSPATDPAP